MHLGEHPFLRWLFTAYAPAPDDRSFLERAQTQAVGPLEVTAAVLGGDESRKVFGVPMDRRGIQPVWLRIANRGAEPYRLSPIGVDPSYYTPLEAAAANRFSTGGRILGFGAMAWLFLPFIGLLPLKLIGAWLANRRMEGIFQASAFRLRPIFPGRESSGFLFTSLDAGTKVLHVRLSGPTDEREAVFSVPVPGLKADHLHRDFPETPAGEAIECDVPELRRRIGEMPRATTDRRGRREGDPVNLVIAGEFPVILGAFGARWDETETITAATVWKTMRSFLLGSEYRYSPVSPLHLFGRSQDFALQRVRRSIHERLHLRLWATALRFQGKPVWVGQVSRDIGVRFTRHAWNLTTHRIDPDVDEARDYVVEDLLEAERVDLAGYMDGVGACDREAPRRNLTGDFYFTDGRRAAILISEARMTPRYVAWQ